MIEINHIHVIEKKMIIEKMFQQLGAEQIHLTSGPCWILHGLYFRLDIIHFHIKPFFVIECTDKLEEAEHNIFEDTDPFPYDLEKDLLFEEVNFVLGNT